MHQAQFTEEVLIYKNEMYRLALRILQNEEDAKDVVQDSFFKLWNKRKDLRAIKNLKSFVLTMVRNASIDMIRKRKPQDNKTEIPELSGNSNPEMILDLSDQLKKVKQFINQLNNQQRELIQLRDIEELDYNEISEITGLSKNNIRVSISRARKEIRQKMLETMSFHQIKRNII